MQSKKLVKMINTIFKRWTYLIPLEPISYVCFVHFVHYSYRKSTTSAMPAPQRVHETTLPHVLRFHQGQFGCRSCLLSFQLISVLLLNTTKERGSAGSAMWQIVAMCFWERGTQGQLCAECVQLLQFAKGYKQNNNFSHWQSMGIVVYETCHALS